MSNSLEVDTQAHLQFHTMVMFINMLKDNVHTLNKARKTRDMRLRSSKRIRGTLILDTRLLGQG